MKIQLRVDKAGSERKTRIYIFEEGENTIRDQVGDDLRSAQQIYKIMLEQLLIQEGVIENKNQLRWSSTAGCSCGCSPGFIVNGSYGKEVFVTLTHE